MNITFTQKERNRIRLAWDVFAPKVEQWLASPLTAEDAEQGSQPKPERPQTRLYWHDFIQPVKDVLQAAPGHCLTLDQVNSAVEQKLKSKFTARDRKVLTSGIVRWKTFVNQVGVELRKTGYLSAIEDRGVWRIKS